MPKQKAPIEHSSVLFQLTSSKGLNNLMSSIPSKKYICPKHAKPLVKKRVFYGMPAGPESVPKNAIIGGCLYYEDRPYGYECPEDGEVYFLDKNGKLKAWDDE